MPNSRKVKVIKHLTATPVKPKTEMPVPPGLDKKTVREITRQVNAWVTNLRKRPLPHPFFTTER